MYKILLFLLLCSYAFSPTLLAQNLNKSFEQLLEDFPIQEVPMVDSTNFDNFEEAVFYGQEERETLQLQTVLRHKGKPFFRIAPSYQLDLSEKFKTLVVTILIGEHEMESYLLNYDLTGKLLDFEIVAYDEIAESMIRVEAEIKEDMIIQKIENLIEVQIDKWQIQADGKIIKIAGN